MSTNPYDAIVQGIAVNRGGSALYQVQDSDPEKAGRANRAAEILGIPADLVEADLPAMEQRIRMEQARAGFAKDPKLAAWASDPRHAALATDDFENMKRLSDARAKMYGVLKAPPPTAPTFGNFWRGVGTRLSEGFWQSRVGVNLQAQDFINWLSPSKEGERQAAKLKREQDASQWRITDADPAFKGRYTRYLYSGVASTAQAVPALAAGILTRNPYLPAAIMGGQVQSQSYGKYRARGATPSQAFVGATSEGTIEGAMELLPMGFVVNKFGKAPVTHFIAGTLAREVPTEVATTIAQNAVDTAIANPDKTWGDYFKELPSDIAETVGATIVQSFLLGGPSALAGHFSEREQAVQAETDAGFLNDLASGTAESKVRKRDPSAFARFLEMQLDGSPAENLYIPAEKVRELFQSPVEMSEDPFWGQHADQIEEATALGGDVVVKTSDFTTHVAGTPAWEALKDHIRTSPAGMSLAEAREWAKDSDEAMQKTGEQIAEQMARDREAMAPRQKLFEATRDKLMRVGFTPDVAMVNAELFAARQATRASRLGRELTGTEADAVDVRATDAEGADVTFTQSNMGGKRGSIAFTQGKPIISLFEGRNLSTFAHEGGHLFLEELKADAESKVSPQVTADFEQVRGWFKKQGIKMPKDGSIPTEAHELWARGFERYLMEGKAPSSALRKAFDAFKRWLLTIYQVVDNLRAPISPEVRAVMDRLLATDEEIRIAREEQNIDALFTSAQEAGMTDAEFAQYRKAAEDSRDEAHDALLYRTMAAIRREKTQAWKDEAATVRADVTEQVDRQPVFRALRALKETKLDTQWVIDTLGEDALSLLPKRVPPIHAKNGSHPDDIAEASGFASGDEMIRELMGLEQATRAMRDAGDKRSVRQAQIDQRTQEIMLERHGDILNDGTIEEEARAAVHNDKQGEVIASEIRSLARRTGKRPTPYALAKAWAADRIASGTVVETTSGSAIQRYERAAKRAAKAAEEAMLKGDVDETYRQKQAQMLNNALISEARKAKDAVDAAVTNLSKIAKRKTSPSIDQAYLEQAHDLLEQVEFRPRSQRSIERQQSFEEWAKEQQAKGHDVVVPDSFAASLGTTHWSRLQVSQLIALNEAVSQIVHLGRLKQKLIDAREARDYEEVIAEALLTAGNLDRKPPSDLMDPSWGERFKSGLAGADAALLKMETIVDWLDGNIPNGVFNRIVFAPIAEAQTRENDLFTSYIGQLDAAMAAVPKKTLKRWADHITAPELLNRETGNPWTLARQQLISMALNMGNEGNAQRLADGYGWNEASILQVLNRELTQDEWTYVQSVWDIIDGLWPEIEAMEKRVNGLAPERIEARAIETSGGSLRGGYYPAVYDATRDYTAEGHAGAASDLFETLYTRATTRSSATKERADKVKRPILLDLGVITRHVGEVIHDITHREAVMNADKFLSDQRIKKAVDETLGREIRGQFRPWLKFVANQWALERAGNEGLGKLMNKLRSNATVVGMGFRISTIMMQWAGYSNSFEVVGARWVAEGVARFAANPVASFNFVMEKSGEIRHRMDTIDRDVNSAIRRLAGKTNPLTEVKRFAFHGIGMMDRAVCIPTWIGAYNKALASGATDEDAVYTADKAVRQSQGSGAAKDMAAVMRGQGQWGQALKLMTMFYSYVSAVYQRQRTLGRDVRQASAKDIPALMARAWWLIVVPPILSELLSGRGPDEDEDWSWWAFKQMLLQGLGAVPLVRDVARPLWDKLAGNKAFDYQLSPIQRVGQSLVNVGGDIHNIATGEETKRATRDTLEAAGYWTGLVPGQVASATQFLVDVGYGEQEPETVGDWYEGLTTGKIAAE